MEFSGSRFLLGKFLTSPRRGRDIYAAKSARTPRSPCHRWIKSRSPGAQLALRL